MMMYEITVQPQNPNSNKMPVFVSGVWFYKTGSNSWLMNIEGKFNGVSVGVVRRGGGVCLYDPYGTFEPTNIDVTCTDRVEFVKIRNSLKVAQVLRNDESTSEEVSSIQVAFTDIPEDAWEPIATWKTRT